jgi:NAD(P)H-hydrate epimerase
MKEPSDIPGVILNKASIASLIRPRDPASHKGSHGHALLVAGNKGRMGAAVLSARACLRTGAGLVTVNVPEAERGIIQTALPEAMLMIREDGGDINQFSAIGIGPALGLQDESWKLIENIFDIYAKPVLLDADALTLLSLHKSYWPVIPPGSILTPHPGEFDRLFGQSDTHEERIKKALELSGEHQWVIVLKNNRTIIAVDGNAYTNTTGNSGLAKGGSGDVLSGMILSLLAQGYAPSTAAQIGVYLHGLSADIAVKNQSLESLLASDVIECIGKAFRQTQTEH